MSYKFNVQSTIGGVPVDFATAQLSDPAFHEKVCYRLPATDLVITESSLAGSQYTLKREYNLDVNIPDIARKFLKSAFRLRREDFWNLAQLNAESHFYMNMPGEFHSRTVMKHDANGIHIHQDWEVIIRVPLIHNLLAKHAEAEIRRFRDIELDIIRDELGKAFQAA